MSDRNNDSNGRWRKRIVAFRVSDEEAELINRLVDISGLTKQDYILKRLTNHEVVVRGSIRMFGSLKVQLEHIREELKRLKKINPENSELLELLRMCEVILDKLADNQKIIEQQRLEAYEKKFEEILRNKNRSMGNRRLKSFKDRGGGFDE